MSKHTNKKTLSKGLKFLAIALLFTFIGPSVLYSAFHNQDKPLFIPILIIGVLATFGAILMMFRGIMTIVKALFD
ncbi:MAG: DUF6095 family protein [Bacteroidota bacterium]|uniref:Uncharacterized protein n=1 Tax=Christiangramia flava JLT2011 TaxID=1229726 RepID=A0A1L7I1X3_9FLAO|nr:DUF6095 family protein [Christiangramia flava]APU67183.1 hypothetical protein GRFL_0459 [Christiangramia flava JLT2011]MAM18263.1 hypothetical protein [Christiangramia sp.]MEE2771360.1 DUF6095 family protein [Bacteroidota bacterium]OSS38044.1 hypothetical protein C723_2943 [Christiangramia flava JLT2011]